MHTTLIVLFSRRRLLGIDGSGKGRGSRGEGLLRCMLWLCLEVGGRC